MLDRGAAAGVGQWIMTVFWIVMGLALVGGLFLAWRTDHKTKARRIALQGQQPGRMQDVIGDPNVAVNVHNPNNRGPGGLNGGGGGSLF